jgi:hypothetical protein
MKSHAWRVLHSTEHYRCLVCERCGASKHYSRAGLTDDIQALQTSGAGTLSQSCDRGWQVNYPILTSDRTAQQQEELILQEFRLSAIPDRLTMANVRFVEGDEALKFWQRRRSQRSRSPHPLLV